MQNNNELRCICGCAEFIDSGDKYTSVMCKSCKTVYDKKTHKMIFQSHHSKQLIQKQSEKDILPTIACPYCQSTNTQKISGLSKAGSVALWGIFALGKTTKQFHCNNCKADF